jgi:hypothetical protein
MRTRQAEERNAELQKIAELRRTDEALMEDAGAAAIPERVAQHMGKRMFPFVVCRLLGVWLVLWAFGTWRRIRIWSFSRRLWQVFPLCF